jgi:hypothetical protein
MNTTAEKITFMIVRGTVALAIVGVGFYCIAQGIHFFALPRVEAEQIRISLVGLDISASGLGAVIFGTGLGLCFVAKRTAPNRIEATRTTRDEVERDAEQLDKLFAELVPAEHKHTVVDTHVCENIRWDSPDDV